MPTHRTFLGERGHRHTGSCCGFISMEIEWNCASTELCRHACRIYTQINSKKTYYCNRIGSWAPRIRRENLLYVFASSKRELSAYVLHAASSICWKICVLNSRHSAAGRICVHEIFFCMCVYAWDQRKPSNFLSILCWNDVYIACKYTEFIVMGPFVFARLTIGKNGKIVISIWSYTYVQFQTELIVRQLAVISILLITFFCSVFLRGIWSLYGFFFALRSHINGLPI